MTRILGTQHRSEFILDPVEAWHRGRVLDRVLAQAPAATGTTPAEHPLLETDSRTGRRYLRLPVPDPNTLARLAEADAHLLPRSPPE